MKKFFLFTLCLQVFSSLAQNYDNIATPGLTFFNNGNSEIFGYRYDSVTFNGVDSVYQAPRLILRTNFYSCADTSAAPILSRTIIRKSDGTFKLLKISGDTILFLSQASLNQVWTCCALSEGRRVDAQVTDIRSDTVADTIDMVKEITFMARNQNGTVFPHPINGIKILLSKHFGFAKTIEWWYFPDSTGIWTMKGKSYPKVGVQDFSYKQCFDYQPGDEFHYLYSQFSGMVNTHIIEKILQKNFAAGDTIIYSKEICWIKWYPTPPPNTESYHDTVTVIITGDGGAIFTSIPEQFKPYYYNGEWHADRFFKTVETFNNREQKKFSSWFFCHPDSCWTEYCGGVDNYSVDYEYYGEGLGETGWYNEWWNGTYHEVNRKDLVYYKKGKEEWGTPFAPDCDVLLTTKKIISELQTIMVFPNPITSGEPIFIKENVSGCTATIIDISGKLVYKSTIYQNKPLIITGSILPGIYLFILTDKIGECKGRTKLIVN